MIDGAVPARRAFAGGGAPGWRRGWRRSLHRSRRVLSPSGAAAVARRGSRWPSAGRAWCGKTPRRAAASARAGAPPKPGRARVAKRRAAMPASALSRGVGAIENGDRHSAKDVLPAPPIWELPRGCRRPSARRSGCAESAGAAAQRVGGVARAEPGLDVADPDARVAAATAAAAARRSREGRHAGAGFSGFCGETSHHTSSRSSRLQRRAG